MPDFYILQEFAIIKQPIFIDLIEWQPKMDNLKLPETPTIKELADFLGITRQGLEKRIKKMATVPVATNKSGYLIVLPEGLKQLSEHYPKLSDYFDETVAEKADDNDKKEDSNPLPVLIQQLDFERKRYEDLALKFDRQQHDHGEQLKAKDRQIEDLTRLLSESKKSFWARLFGGGK